MKQIKNRIETLMENTSKIKKYLSDDVIIGLLVVAITGCGMMMIMIEYSL
jgi:hypothetical protein